MRIPIEINDNDFEMLEKQKETLIKLRNLGTKESKEIKGTIDLIKKIQFNRQCIECPLNSESGCQSIVALSIENNICITGQYQKNIK